MRRRGPRKTGYWSRSRVDQKFHVLPDWLFVAEVVILLEQAVVQRLLRRTPHGVVSISRAVAFCRPGWYRVVGLKRSCRGGGKAMCPARSRPSSNPRQTMSRGAPLTCFHPQASHRSKESRRRVAPG